MLNAIQGMDASYIWSGVIWALVCGLAVGNYACSLIHRLPRGKSLLGDAPYCGTCAAPLKPIDLFPVFSALWLRHKCRYCHTPYPISHTITELLVAALFILTFFQYNFSDIGVLILAIGTFLIILSTIQVNEGMIMGRVILCALVFGMLLRTLIDHTLFNFVLGGLFGVIVGAVVWRKKIVKAGHIYKLPVQAELLAVAGICVGANLFPLFLLVFSVVYFLAWVVSKILHKQLLFTIAFSFSLMLVLLYGK